MEYSRAWVAAGAGAVAQTSPEGSHVVDSNLLRRVLVSPPPGNLKPFEWQGHVDYARREYMKALIERYNGDLREIAGHWNKSSKSTLLKLIRDFQLEDELHAARKKREQHPG